MREWLCLSITYVFVTGTTVNCFHKMYHVDDSCDGKVCWKRCVKDNRKGNLSIYKHFPWLVSRQVSTVFWQLEVKHLSLRSELYMCSKNLTILFPLNLLPCLHLFLKAQNPESFSLNMEMWSFVFVMCPGKHAACSVHSRCWLFFSTDKCVQCDNLFVLSSTL